MARFERIDDDGQIVFFADCADAIYWQFVGASDESASGPFVNFSEALANANADPKLEHVMGEDWSDWFDRESNLYASCLPPASPTE